MRRWEAGGVVPVMPPSLEHLDVLLLTFSTRRRVQQDGIAFQGQRYFDVALAEYVGEDVVVRYDPSNREEIAVYVPELPLANALEDVRERFVCRARCWEVGREGIRAQICQTLGREREASRALESLGQQVEEAYQRTAAHVPSNAALQIEQRDGADVPNLERLERVEEPESLRGLREYVGARLPPVDLPEVMLEVAQQTGFFSHFTHVSDSSAYVEDLPFP
ncbi:hypothetical protein KSD_00630 [Ktedonobacter sp. SOSP1-85]|nr:hypothetical protein KSD_00630 [Ktedonobacter sp. SOSP1-85]